VAGEVRREGWRILPLGLGEAVAAAGPESPHRDPFARLLAAQSELHDFAIVTTNRFFKEAGFRTLW
jgi:PIN domain nuclease of toxin-antitoxin system